MIESGNLGRATQRRSAEGIGFAQDLGSLEPGERADLRALNKDSLENLGNTNTIRKVMKNGELFEGDTWNGRLARPCSHGPRGFVPRPGV